jgi:hypothetical protein
MSMRLLSLLLIVAACLPMGCGRRHRDEGPALDVVAAAKADANIEHQKKVAAMTQRYMADAKGEKGRLVRNKPYYFKTYSEYGDAPGADAVQVEERQARTAPLAASVKIPVTRYTTNIHRNRDEAQADENYFRSTGSEKVNFELRSGKWQRVGSLFVADKTEEKVKGEWIARKEPPKVEVYEGEDKRGWFKRFWSGLTGRY